MNNADYFSLSNKISFSEYAEQKAENEGFKKLWKGVAEALREKRMQWLQGKAEEIKLRKGE